MDAKDGRGKESVGTLLGKYGVVVFVVPGLCELQARLVSAYETFWRFVGALFGRVQ